MKKFIDTESENIITESELKKEFEELKENQPDEYNYTFEEYIQNCTAKNGFLKEIKNLCVCEHCLAAIESHEGRQHYHKHYMRLVRNGNIQRNIRIIIRKGENKMSRNLKKEYIKKMLGIEKNGYKFDIANYIYNPAHGNEYPAFVKKISENSETETFRRVYYFKYYDGTGEYLAETYTRKKNGDTWQVISNRTEEKLESGNRYNVNKLLEYCI